jgi:hypothetical protein
MMLALGTCRVGGSTPCQCACTPPGIDNRALSAVRAVHPEQGVPGPKLCEGLPVSHTGSVPRYRGFGCGQEVCVWHSGRLGRSVSIVKQGAVFDCSSLS